MKQKAKKHIPFAVLHMQVSQERKYTSLLVESVLRSLQADWAPHKENPVLWEEGNKELQWRTVTASYCSSWDIQSPFCKGEPNLFNLAWCDGPDCLMQCGCPIWCTACLPCRAGPQPSPEGPSGDPGPSQHFRFPTTFQNIEGMGTGSEGLCEMGTERTTDKLWGAIISIDLEEGISDQHHKL